MPLAIKMLPKYIDIHSHLHFPDYNIDREEVIGRALNKGVWMINIGTNKQTSEEVVSLAEKYKEGVYASIGLHPIHTDNSCCQERGEASSETEFDYEFYKKLAEHPKVVAIGECGLDFFHLDEESKQKQIDIFEKHIELALDVNKPLMLHIRDNPLVNEGGNAYEKVLDILSKFNNQDFNIRGNVHFFAGSLENAKRFLEMGFSLSFTGVITYPMGKNNPDYEEIIKYAPLNRIMAETDAPYVAPIPYRGQRNESLYVVEVYKRIASIKDISIEEASSAIVDNSLKFFNI